MKRIKRTPIMRMKPVSLVLYMASLLLIASFASIAAGQDISRPAATSRGGSLGSTSDITEVVMDDLPQVTTAEVTALKQLLRPRDGRTDAQYAEMKSMAAHLAANGVVEGGNTVGPAPSQSSALITTTHQFAAQREV